MDNTRMSKGMPHILLVDDDRLVLTVLESGLTEMGYRVSAIDNGKDALEFFLRTSPDLVLLDVRMPAMDGLETAQAMLTKLFRPILLLSAYDDQATVKNATGLGIAGYLVKPITTRQLAPSIETTLARFAEINALMKNTNSLREGTETNRIISTAVGIVMERAALSQDMAFERLRKLARDQRRELRDIAVELIDATSLANSIALEQCPGDKPRSIGCRTGPGRRPRT